MISHVLFPSLNKNEVWRLIVFSDASHVNLSEGTGSMGAHLFLVDSDGNCCTLSWQRTVLGEDEVKFLSTGCFFGHLHTS